MKLLVILTASFPYSAYFLAFDNERIAQAFAKRYGDTPAAGRNFLEKIVQVLLALLPINSTQLMSMTIEGINSAMSLAKIEATKEDEERFSEFFDKASSARWKLSCLNPGSVVFS